MQIWPQADTTPTPSQNIFNTFQSSVKIRTRANVYKSNSKKEEKLSLLHDNRRQFISSAVPKHFICLMTYIHHHHQQHEIVIIIIIRKWKFLRNWMRLYHAVYKYDNHFVTTQNWEGYRNTLCEVKVLN